MCTYLKLISSLGNESRGLVEVKERKRKIVLFKGHEVIGRSAFSNSSPPSFWHLSSMCIVSSKPLPSFSWLRSTVTLKNNQKVTNNLLTAYMTIISFPHFLCFIVKYGTHVNFKTKKSKTKTECCYEKQPIPPPPKHGHLYTQPWLSSRNKTSQESLKSPESTFSHLYPFPLFLETVSTLNLVEIVALLFFIILFHLDLFLNNVCLVCLLLKLKPMELCCSSPLLYNFYLILILFNLCLF